MPTPCTESVELCWNCKTWPAVSRGLCDLCDSFGVEPKDTTPEEDHAPSRAFHQIGSVVTAMTKALVERYK